MTKYEKLFIEKIGNDLCLIDARLSLELDQALFKIELIQELQKLSETIQEEMATRPKNTSFYSYLETFRGEIETAAEKVAALN